MATKLRSSLVLALGLGLVVGSIGSALIMPTGGWSPADRTVRLESFQRTGDRRQIVVTVVIGLGDRIVETSAREDDRTVIPIVRVRSPGGVRQALGIVVPAAVPLREPLADRTVRDEAGQPVLDLGMYQPARELPIDLNEIGIVERGSYEVSGDVIDLSWRNASGRATRTLAGLRGSTVVMLSRTSFSSDSKLTLLALQERLWSLPPNADGRVVVVLITLNEDPARAAIVRPSSVFHPLVAYADMTGSDAPEILRFTSVPVIWFVGPDGTVRHRVEGRAASAADIERGLESARR